MNKEFSKKKIAIISAIVVILMAVVVFAIYSTNSAPKDVNYKTEGYIELGKYKGLKLKEVKVSVSDKELKTEISRILVDAKKSKEVKEGTVKNGDTVIIDYVGTVGGEKFEGGTANDSKLTIGEGQYIPGFESGMIGMKVGSTKDVKVKFPDDYGSADLAGKNAVFKITVKALVVETIPKLDLKFVKSQGDYSSVAEYEKDIKNEIYKAKLEEAKNDEKTRLFNIIMDDSLVLKYPQKQIDRVKEQARKQLEDDAKKYNVSMDTFVQQSMGIQYSELEATLDQYAESIVKRELIIYGIAQKEGIEFDKKDYKEYVEKMLKKIGLTDSEFKKQYGETIEEMYGEEDIYLQMYIEAVLEKVKEYGKK